MSSLFAKYAACKRHFSFRNIFSASVLIHEKMVDHLFESTKKTNQQCSRKHSGNYTRSSPIRVGFINTKEKALK
jgi:hypothetical protein